jgi:hypothetical protein
MNLQQCRRTALIMSILALLLGVPSARGDDIPDVVQNIRAEVAKPNRDPGGRPLPVASHWANGFNGANFSSDYQIGLLEKGHHLVPTLPFPQPGAERYPPVGKPFVEKLARWRAPFALRAGQWESVLYEKDHPASDPGKWRNLPPEKSPLEINLEGKIKAKLSPWGAVVPWQEAGLYQTGSKAFKELEEWYPDPPRVLLMSNNEASKLRPKDDVEAESKRYLDAHGKGKSPTFIRGVMADGYVERYRALLKGIKEGLPNEAWRKNSLTVAYGGFGPSHFGRMDSWPAYSYATDQRIHPWHLAWEGGSPSYYVHDWNPSTDYRVWSPQVESNNWVFMLEETYRENPEFWFELSIWDGNLGAAAATKGKVNKKDHYLKAGQEWSADRYAGFVQYGMWLLTPRVVREFRGSTLPRAEHGKDFEALLAGVDRVWTNPVLTRIWRHGKLVANRKNKHPYQIGIPKQWQEVDRWFQLDTSVDPPRPWKLDTELPVFSLARVVGDQGTREWLVYAHAPVKSRKDVVIDLPDFGKVTVNVTPRGNFYLVKEKDRSVSALPDR